MSTDKPIFLYLAGPYRGGPDNSNIPVNVAESISWFNILTDMGFTVFCPHLNMFMDMFQERSGEFWLAWDIKWLRKCDVLFRMPGESRGSDKEWALAKELGMPCFVAADAILAYFSWRNKREH